MRNELLIPSLWCHCLICAIAIGSFLWKCQHSGEKSVLSSAIMKTVWASCTSGVLGSLKAAPTPLESPSFLPLWFSEEVQWGVMAQTCLKRPCIVRSFPGNWCVHERWRTSALEGQAANFSCKRPEGKYLATTQLCLCSLKIPTYSTERIELGCVPVELYFWTQNFEFHILVSRSRIILWVWGFFTIIFFIIIFFVVDFVIHWNETAMGLHVFPIPIPPPTSLSTRSP